MKRVQAIREFIEALISIWNEVKPTRMAAALAYYGMFSFVPVVYIAIRVAGIFINDVLLSQQVYDRLATTFGQNTATFVQDLILATDSTTTGGSTVATLVSAGALLYAASGLFFNLQYSLNTVWQVPPSEYAGILNNIKNRLMAFIMVIGVGLTLVLGAFSSLIVSSLTTILPFEVIDPLLSALAFIGLATLAFALLFKFLPEVKIAWRDVWLGALVTALIVSIGAWAIGFYFSISGVGSAFEAAGALAVLLIGINYIAQIFLAGAVFTRVYTMKYGSKSKLENA
jgi:membrane protein